MANEIAKNFAAEAISAGSTITATTLYTLTAGKRALITSIHLHNTKVTNRTAQLYRVPNGGSLSDVNMLHKVILAPGETWQWNGFSVLDTAGDSIQIEIDPDLIYGDADEDDDVDNTDAAIISSMSVGATPTPAFNSVAFIKADADGNGQIDAADALQVTQLVAGARSTVSAQDEAVFVELDGVEEDV